MREIAEHGYGAVTVDGIAERAGVSRRVFYSTFEDKQEALIWAYDAAAAYAIPQILDALAADRDWVRGGGDGAGHLPDDPRLRPRLGAGLPARRAGRGRAGQGGARRGARPDSARVARAGRGSRAPVRRGRSTPS